MPHEGAVREAAHMLVRRVAHRVAGAIDEDAHRLRFVSRVHHGPHTRRPLWVESCVEDFRTLRHRDFLFFGDLDRIFVDGLHVVDVVWRFEAEPCGAAKIRGVVVLFRGDALSAPILADLIVLPRKLDSDVRLEGEFATHPHVFPEGVHQVVHLPFRPPFGVFVRQSEFPRELAAVEAREFIVVFPETFPTMGRQPDMDIMVDVEVHPRRGKTRRWRGTALNGFVSEWHGS